VAGARDADQADGLTADDRGAIADFLDLRGAVHVKRLPHNLILSAVVDLFPLRRLYRRRGAILYARLK
jgi:hypothetical protein